MSSTLSQTNTEMPLMGVHTSSTPDYDNFPMTLTLTSDHFGQANDQLVSQFWLDHPFQSDIESKDDDDGDDDKRMSAGYYLNGAVAKSKPGLAKRGKVNMTRTCEVDEDGVRVYRYKVDKSQKELYKTLFTGKSKVIKPKLRSKVKPKVTLSEEPWSHLFMDEGPRYNLRQTRARAAKGQYVDKGSDDGEDDVESAFDGMVGSIQHEDFHDGYYCDANNNYSKKKTNKNKSRFDSKTTTPFALTKHEAKLLSAEAGVERVAAGVEEHALRSLREFLRINIRTLADMGKDCVDGDDVEEALRRNHFVDVC